MKSQFILSFLFFSTISSSNVIAETIFANGADISLDLTGYDGRDGHRGGLRRG